jgi:tetratricopeptide (TPR) repeat protein
MDFDDQIRVLQAAQGDPARLALATVDLAYPALPDAERGAIKEALEAAAVPHWCDELILATLLQIPPADAAARFAHLRGLRVVEPFPARGLNAVNVHEASRLALRKAVAADPRERFGELGRRSVAYFATDLTPSGRIEWIYHLLGVDPDCGATELKKLDRDQTSSPYPKDQYALAAALQELEDTGLAQGRARVWALLVIAWTRVGRGEAAQLGDAARKALSLARNAADPRAEADAQCLLGSVLRAQGKLTDAQAAFGENLAISRGLAEQDPTNAGWQRGLAVAHRWVGGVLQAQGKPTEAYAALGEYLAISCRLAEQDPTNAGWQQELAVAHDFVGCVLQAQGKLTKAQAAFAEALTISHRLAEQDPTNAGWQRGLAVAHGRVGDVLQARGELTEAQAAFARALAISRRLAGQDPTNAWWQRDLVVVCDFVGCALQAQGKLMEARAAFAEALAISRRLAEQDPTNADWQRALAVALSRVGDVLMKAQGNLTEAQVTFGEALAISRRLAEQDPTNVGRQRDLAVACGRVGGISRATGKLTEARAAFGEALAINRRLAEQDPASVDWQWGLAVAHDRVDDILLAQGKHGEALEVVGELERMAPTTSEKSGAEAVRQALKFRDFALGIALKLREGDPQSVSYGRTVAMSLFLSFQQAQSAGDKGMANQCLAGCRKVLYALITLGCQLDPPMMQIYQQINEAAGGPLSKT